MPHNDDEVKRLEHVLEEIQYREAHEEGRQSSADSKLSGALAILPIIVGLATTAFFEMLPHAAALGSAGVGLAIGFVIALVCFLIAAFFAINGLWPRKSGYVVVALPDIEKYMDQGTYVDQLCEMISERSDAILENGKVNGRKLGRYMDSQKWIISGLIVLTMLTLFWSVALIARPGIFIQHSSMDAKPCATPTPAHTHAA